MRPCMFLVVYLLIIGSAGGSIAFGGPPPVRFELIPLGVFGGEVESNSSCFLLREAGNEETALMIDGGSPVSGIIKWKGLDSANFTWSKRMAGVADVLATVQAILITHSHLDHNYGVVLKSPIHLSGKLAGTQTSICGNEATIQAYRDVYFSKPAWGNFTHVPSAEKPAFPLVVLEEEKPSKLGGFDVELYPLAHPVPSSGFVFTADDGSAFIHLGDTGRSKPIWKRGRNLLKSGKLRAVSLEVSFDTAKEPLAVRTGHLTPASLVLELNSLTGAIPTEDLPEEFEIVAAQDLAKAVADHLRDVRILIHHIKPTSYSKVVDELDLLKKAGLPLEVLHQARPVRF